MQLQTISFLGPQVLNQIIRHRPPKPTTFSFTSHGALNGSRDLSVGSARQNSWTCTISPISVSFWLKRRLKWPSWQYIPYVERNSTGELTLSPSFSLPSCLPCMQFPSKWPLPFGDSLSLVHGFCDFEVRGLVGAWVCGLHLKRPPSSCWSAFPRATILTCFYTEVLAYTLWNNLHYSHIYTIPVYSPKNCLRKCTPSSSIHSTYFLPFAISFRRPCADSRITSRRKQSMNQH